MGGYKRSNLVKKSTIHGETCASVFNNHEDLMELWEWSLGNIKRIEMKAQIIGAKVIHVYVCM